MMAQQLLRIRVFTDLGLALADSLGIKHLAYCVIFTVIIKFSILNIFICRPIIQD